MDATGTLQVRVTTSRAELPVMGAAVIVTAPAPDGKRRLAAVLETDESGLCPPLTLPAPGMAQGLTPGGERPYATYSLWVEHPAYQVAVVEGFQVFPGMESVQNISLVPRGGGQWGYGPRENVIRAEPQPL